MEVNYTLTPQDVTTFQKFVVGPSMRFAKIRWAMVVIVVLVLIASFFWEYLFPSQNARGQVVHKASNWTDLAVSVGMPVALIAFFWVYFLRSGRTEQLDQDPFSDSQSISISAENLEWRFKGSKMIMAWSSVPNITGDENSLYFFTGKDQAYIVPRRAFLNPDDCDLFYETAIAYWKWEPPPNKNDNIWPPQPNIGAR